MTASHEVRSALTRKLDEHLRQRQEGFTEMGVVWVQTETILWRVSRVGTSKVVDMNPHIEMMSTKGPV